ncbi:MAG: hypothetical protein AAGA23_20640 [Pseudomonadota bacterium]
MMGALNLKGCWVPLIVLAASWLPLAAASDWVGDSANLPEQALLAVSIVSFAPSDQADLPQNVRDSEALYFSYLARQVLEESEQWGPVRMVPISAEGFELEVSGKVVRSSPEQLTIRFSAVDASGRVWLDGSLDHQAAATDYAEVTEPHAQLFADLNAALITARQDLSLSQLEGVITLGELRRAAWLVPQAFGGLLTEAEGRYTINRLPARDDPLFSRVQRIQQAQELYTDTVDPTYRAFFDEMQPTYILWRRALFESNQMMTAYRQQSAGRKARDKSARALYFELRERKLFEQTLRETMESFLFEARPTAIRLEGEVQELSGTLTEQASQWQDILRRIYEAEVGLDLPTVVD